MARVITLVLCVGFGLVFLSRSCTITRSGAPIALLHGRIVSATGRDEVTRFVTISGGRIAAVVVGADQASLPSGARQIDANGLYIAATTFDREAPKLIDGIRHVWVGQITVGAPGDVVIMRASPGRIRPGYVPETNAIVGAIVNGVYYTARELNTPR